VTNSPNTAQEASDCISTASNILSSIFGYPAFRGPQADIITHLADGNDCLVLMPTGAANRFAIRYRR